MPDSILGIPLTFLGGLIGGGGIVGAYFTHLLRRRETLHSAKVARVVERRADVYRRCAALLRSIRGTPMVVAIDQFNALADEMLLWASADVYREFSSFTLRMVKDLRGEGNIVELILPTLRAMANDINPGLDLNVNNVIPHITFVDHGTTDALWSAAWHRPEQFNKIASLLKHNAELMSDLVRHRAGDYDAVAEVILAHFHSPAGRDAASSTTSSAVPLDAAVATAVLQAFVSHPSRDTLLSLGQIAEWVDLSLEATSAYLDLLRSRRLVEFGRSPGGRPHFALTDEGRRRVRQS